MRLATLCLLLTSALTYCCQADEPSKTAQLSATIEAVFEGVLDHHIEPPTRQQMVLALLRRLHRTEKPAVLAELSRAVSNLGTKETLYQFMRQEIQQQFTHLEFDPDHPHRIAFDWLSSTVPGGIDIEDPKNVDVAKQLAANRYVGIGVQLSRGDQSFVFTKILENGTAERGGILAGDHLLKINDVPVSGDMEQVVDQLRGPEGSSFRVTVQTKQESPRDIELRRQVVLMKTMKLEPLEPEATVAFITVENIKASSVHELQSLIERLPDTIKQVTLNLQFDGNFHYFCLFADALLDAGQLGRVVTREGTRSIKTSDGNVLMGRKLKIVLTDRAEQQQLLSLLAQHTNRDSARSEYIPALYLRESRPILDGQVVLTLATRRFDVGAFE